MRVHDDIPRDILRPQRLHQTRPPAISGAKPLPKLPNKLRHHNQLRLRGIPPRHSPKENDDVIGREPQVQLFDRMHAADVQGAWCEIVLWRSRSQHSQGYHWSRSADYLRSIAVGPLRKEILLRRRMTHMISRTINTKFPLPFLK